LPNNCPNREQIASDHHALFSIKWLLIILLFIGILASGQTYAVTINDITQLNPIVVNQIVSPQSIAELRQLVREHHGPISIAGGRYSQGGQIADNNGLVIDMRRLNKIIFLDEKKRQITVEAGATWREIQNVIDPKGFSIQIMQSYSNFTVGGSLSVNVHGRYVNRGPVICSVDSIKIVLADGSLKEASRVLNSDLFYGAIGGYGGLGVIVEATLNLDKNTPIERRVKTMPITEYKKYFFDTIANSKIALFHNANLYPTDYTMVRSITWNLTDKPVTIKTKLASDSKLTRSQQFLLSWITHSKSGKLFYRNIYEPYILSGNAVAWRNYESSEDVASLEPTSRKKETYVLQEYFVPPAHFDSFVNKMRFILQSHHVNVLNISIRYTLADPGTLLAWARQPVFSFVIYYEQGVTNTAKKEVSTWTSQLIDAVLSEEGTYYLTYQIIATKKQFLLAYPNATNYFILKRKVDPTNKFRNRLLDRYQTP